MTAPTAPTGSSMIPRHIAVIMDGNGRWARRRGLPRVAGHRKGVERVRELVQAAGELGVRYLTLFAFSSENWRRPAQEVQMLLELFLGALDREVAKLHEKKVRFRVIGDVARFPEALAARIRDAETLTADNGALTLTIAANYGGRWDIAQACAEIARRAVAGEIDPARISPATVEAFLSTRELPEPDLFVRSGGEQRISNFLLWQLAYTELHFTPALWPEFDRTELEAALASYASRQRRFGLTGEQVEAARNA
ncbi:UDP pyrophosphate synthase [Sulfurifustis variabilis]|uniref:Ditrans,polycis-undecaprenyl-diphosphate synthase ((2E,6E)-farnesyl-diphosphate specific) n=2 Tax=Sulfurifustis variabilis TaxID=1675686 RepID=A0A1B4V3Q8_9GAMM|nr:UDP pyrophosphate synthase [Sulfurifustis variabilis]